MYLRRVGNKWDFETKSWIYFQNRSYQNSPSIMEYVYFKVMKIISFPDLF